VLKSGPKGGAAYRAKQLEQLPNAMQAWQHERINDNYARCKEPLQVRVKSSMVSAPTWGSQVETISYPKRFNRLYYRENWNRFWCGNKRSSRAIAQAWKNAGVTLAFTYQGQRLKENVEDSTLLDRYLICAMSRGTKKLLRFSNEEKFG
jgi:hypothetical protein